MKEIHKEELHTSYCDRFHKFKFEVSCKVRGICITFGFAGQL
jgi:hypothetical protein